MHYAIFSRSKRVAVFCRAISAKNVPALITTSGAALGHAADAPQDDYRVVMQDICNFDGRYSIVEQRLKQAMNDAAERLDFEQASLWRDRGEALNRLMERQIIVSDRAEDLDVLGFARNGSEAFIQKRIVLEGRIVGTAHVCVEDRGETDAEIIDAFMTQHYGSGTDLPRELLIPVSLPSSDLLAEFLRASAGYAVRLHHPKRGHRRKLLDMANDNAQQSLERHTLLGRSKRYGSQQDAAPSRKHHRAGQLYQPD